MHFDEPTMAWYLVLVVTRVVVLSLRGLRVVVLVALGCELPHFLLRVALSRFKFLLIKNSI